MSGKQNIPPNNSVLKRKSQEKLCINDNGILNVKKLWHVAKAIFRKEIITLSILIRMQELSKINVLSSTN